MFSINLSTGVEGKMCKPIHLRASFTQQSECKWSGRGSGYVFL